MEHKYQWSLFVDQYKNEQFVIRCDDPAEFVAAMELVKKLLSKRPEQDPEPEIPPDQCLLHNALMKERAGKNGHTWYDHRWQEDGLWHICNGKTVKTQQ